MTFHSKFSPSSADRWVNCPGYLSLNDRATGSFGRDRGNAFSDEGTKVHEIIKNLMNQHNPILALNDMSDLDDETKTSISIHICETERILSELTNKKLNPVACYESTISMFSEILQEIITGTPDCVILYDSGLHVVDYKNGMGEVISPDSWQLKLYAYIYMQNITHNNQYQRDFGDVSLTIVQPKVSFVNKSIPAVRTLRTNGEDIKKEVEEMLKRVVENIDLEMYSKGSHCKYCYAMPICPAHVTIVDNILSSNVQDVNQLKYIIDNEKDIQRMIKKAKEVATNGIIDGKIDPDLLGYSLEKSYGNRKWNPALGLQKIVGILRRRGVPKDQIWKKSLISVAQAEKFIENKDGIEKYVVKEETGLKLLQKK